MDRLLINYLPPVVQATQELRAITDAQQEELSIIWDEVDNALKDQFIDDMTTNGTKRWEKILSINPKGTDTLDTRRFRIKTKLNEKLPFSLPFLNQMLSNLCGANGYAVNIGKGTYILYVDIKLEAKDSYQDVSDMLNRVVPAEIVINLTLMYNKHNTLAQFTHKQLSRYTYKELREKVLRFNKYNEVKGTQHIKLSPYTHYQIMEEKFK